jgi:hypothetical protein
VDPLRFRLDRRRVVAILRLTACGVPNAEPLGSIPRATLLKCSTPDKDRGRPYSIATSWSTGVPAIFPRLARTRFGSAP